MLRARRARAARGRSARRLLALAALIAVAVVAAILPGGLRHESAQAQTVPTASADGTYTVPQDWPLIPSGIGPGQTFRLLFVTTTWRDATATDIATYDTFVQREIGRTSGNANQIAHPAIRPYASLFRVVGSTAAVDARDHTNMNPSTDGAGELIYWLNGPQVAANYNGFWQDRWINWAVADRRNQQGTTVPNDWTWTGTNNNGTKSSNPLGYGTGSQVVTQGRAMANPGERGPLGFTSASRRQSHSLYGISPVFKVATDLVELSKSDLRFDEHASCPSGVTSAGATLSSDTYTVKLTEDPGPGRYVHVDIYDPDDMGVGALADDIGKHAGYSVLPRPDTKGRVSVENSRVRRWHGPQGTPPVNLNLGYTRLRFDSSNWSTPQTVTVQVHCAKHRYHVPTEIWHSARIHGGPVVYEYVNLEYPATEGITRPRTHCSESNGCVPDFTAPGQTVTALRRVIPPAEYQSVQAWVNDHDVPQTQSTYAQELTAYADSTSGRGGVLKTTLAWRWALPDADGNDYAHANENFDRFEVSMTTSGQAAQEAIIPAKHPWDKTQWSVALTVLGLPATNWGVVPTPVPYRVAVTPVTIRGDRVAGEVLQFCFEMADTRGYGVWFARSIACSGTIGTPVTARQQTAAAPTLSIAADTASVTEGGVVSFTVTADQAPQTDLTVNVAVEEFMGEGLDYVGQGLASSITMTAGQTTASWSATAYSDSEPRVDGRVEGRIAPGDGYSVGEPSAVAIVLLDDDSYAISEVDITAASGGVEGSSASFTVTADPPPVVGLVVDATVSATGDYGVATGPVSVLIPPSGSATLSVDTTDDNVEEPDGTVTATLNADTGYTLGSSSSQTVDVSDNDAAPTSTGPVLDAQLESDVRSYAAEVQHGTLHVNRWKRVLEAFGVESYPDLEPTTAGEAEAHVDIGRARWIPVAEYLVALEAANPQPAPAPTNAQVDPQVLANVRSYAGETQNGAQHVNRWKRVLEAFGVESYPDLEPMTAAAAQVYADAGWRRWVPIAAQLRLIEAGATTNPPPVIPTVVIPPVVIPPTPEVNILSSSGGSEGATVSFTISANPAPSANLSVGINVVTTGDFGYGSIPSSVTIPTSGSFTLSITTTDDSVDESDGSVSLTLNSGNGYTVGSLGSESVNVTDDDVTVAPVIVVPDPVVSISAGASVTEGGNVEFTVTASPSPSADLPVSVTVSQSGDFGASTGQRTVTIPTSGSVTLSIATSDDSTDESDGSVTATVNSGSGYTVSSSQGSGTVAVSDNDVPPTPVVSISAGNAVTEGGNVEFTVTASPRPTADLDVEVTISQDGDFGASTGSRTVTIPTSGSVTLSIATSDDSVDEPDGSVTATLVDGAAYDLGSSKTGTVAVSDNDITPVVSISAGASVTEGGNVEFTVTASPSPSADLPVSVTVSQSGDFGASTGSRTVTIPTSGSVTLTIATSDDSTDESDGSVTATVNTGSGYTVSSSQGAGTVAVSDNDDAPPTQQLPEVSVADASDIEGSWYLAFVVTLSEASDETVTVEYDIRAGTATNGVDYAIGNLKVIFWPGWTWAHAGVNIYDDSRREADETLTLILTEADGAVITDGTATGTILDDD